MCGIAGFVQAHPKENGSTLRHMTEVIQHRGPDDVGFYRDDWAELGHRRLSIIDLATGHQPMTNEDQRYWIVYNGEVFNHAAVRPELERAGHHYASRCDTETLLHAYEEWGESSVSRFRGMFAYAIWDRERKTLFCVRDRLGIKPFYYYCDGRVFAFASEIKALLEHPAISARLEESVLPEYLAFGYLSGEQTLFAGIRKLMPGHTMTVQVHDGQLTLRTQQYWDVPERPSSEERLSEDEWVRELRRRLEETVQMRLMSDVPLGAFLSGGVDSSAITALMKRMVSGPVKTFSVGYREASYSELSYARQVARTLGTDHHEVVVGRDDFFGALPQLIWHEDEPITWPSSVSLYFVSRLAAQQVKVVLTGEGSDELFAGYERYRHYQFNSRWMQRYQMVPGPLRSLVRQQIAASSLLSAELRRKLGHTFLGREGTLESLHLDNLYCAFSAEELQTIAPSLRGPSPYTNFRRYWDSRPQASLLSRMLYADQKTYLVELLMKQDQMSMATSIESRVPLLDHTLVEFAARMPDRLKIGPKETKHLFKKAVEDLLPHDIIYRTKMGFPTPLRQWLREDTARPLFSRLRESGSLVAEYISRDALENLLRRQQEGREDVTDRIWRLLNLQIWGDLFLTGKEERPWAGQAAQSA